MAAEVGISATKGMSQTNAHLNKASGGHHEYIVERIVNHASTEEETRHIVRWIGHSPTDDTRAPAGHILQQLPTCYGGRPTVQSTAVQVGL